MYENQKRTPASRIALGGVMAALAVVLFSLGGMIPVATYVCPAAAMLILKTVLTLCGRKMAWAWYGAVGILSLLLCPDKEAAAVFVFLGYYPILKPRLDRMKLRWLWKGLLFNSAILVMYWILIHVLGLRQVVEDFAGMGIFFTVLLMILGNVTFFLLDRLLGMRFRRRKHG